MGEFMRPHRERILTYVAGPYSSDPVGNTNRAIDVAEKLQSTGLITAHVPHLNIMWDQRHEHTPDEWLDYDLVFLSKCQALLRITGDSPGADIEVDYAFKNGIMVFFDEETLVWWAAGRYDE